MRISECKDMKKKPNMVIILGLLRKQAVIAVWIGV